MRKSILWLTVIALIVAALFTWIVWEDWEYAIVQTDPLTTLGLVPLSEGNDERITQEIRVEADEIECISLVPGRLRGDAAGEVTLTLWDGDSQLQTISLPVESLQFDALNEISLNPVIAGMRGKLLRLELDLNQSGVSFQYGKMQSAGKVEVSAANLIPLTVQGNPFDGMLLIGTQGRNYLGLSWLAPVLVGLIYLASLAVVLMTERAVTVTHTGFFFMLHEVVNRFGFLLKKLVMRDFKVKYQASVLGVLWSFLNPLLTMTVYLFVFSTIFTSNIEYFPAYLLTGIVLFNYFSESTSLGLNSIVSNRALITKVYMPKMIYPLAKILSSAINLLVSFIPMLIVMLVTGVPFHKSMLLLPLVVLYQVLFCFGMTLILSTLNVFFRDTQFLWGILITVWNFMTPIFYPETIIPAAFQTLYHLNPLYQIVNFMRCITVGGVSPTPLSYLYCVLVSVIPLGIGLLVFRKNQDRFVVYL